VPIAATPSGVLVIDKPSGWSSFDVVARVRRLCGVKRVGHAGTLDPLATGVLPVCLGSATRLVEFLAEAGKEYEATVRLGATSVTYDAEGPITPGTGDLPDAAAVTAALAAFRGPQQQLPPMYSAVQQGGRRLYDLARAGVEVERRPRPVHIYRLELLDYALPDAHLVVECSKGTYIRTLAHDLGAALGCGAYLAALRRTRHGPFGLAAAVTPDDLAAAVAAGDLARLLQPPDVLVADWPRHDVDAATAQRLAQGRPLDHPPPTADTPPRMRVYNPAGALLALVLWDTAQWRPTKVFAAE